jgi:type IV pilus assembly protein PilC
MAQNINLLSKLPARVNLREKAFMTRQLATMLGAGLPLNNCMSILYTQTRKPILKEALGQILANVEEGVTFSRAISKHTRIFDKAFVAIVQSGEASGELEKVLADLAKQYEDEYSFWSKVRSALLYPAFVLTALIAGAIIMSVKILPQLKELFEQSGSQIPWTTRALFAFSTSLINYWWLYIIVVIGLVFLVRWYLNSPDGQYNFHKFQISFPITRTIARYIYMAKFTKTLGMLVAANVPIIKALGIVGEAINNKVYKEDLRAISDQVERGIPMSSPLEKNPHFPLIVSQMIFVGEQTGKLDQILASLDKYFTEELDTQLKSIASLVEPIVIVILGCGVAFFVFSILLPIYQISQLQG